MDRHAEPRFRTLASLGLAAVLLLTCASALAQWKWRDERGRITISDTPPPREIPDKDILQRPQTLTRRLEARAQPPGASASAAASTPAPAASKPSEREIAAKRRAEAEQQARAKEDEARQAAQRAEACRQARAQLAALESGDRLARYNEKGEREVLDDAGRAAEIRRTRDFIAAECR